VKARLTLIGAACAMSILAGVAQAQTVAASEANAPAKVTVDNFKRAETDMYLARFAKQGGFGKLMHARQPASIDNQTVIRMNRDTLYSFGVFDLDAGPLTVTMPDAGKRYMSMQIIDEDHYTPLVSYGAGSHTFTREQIGTRYVIVNIRTLFDPNDAADLRQVHALQDAVKVSQPAQGKLELPAWDAAELKKAHDRVAGLGSLLPSSMKMFGKKGEVDPVRHLVGTAAGWGGLPERDATYMSAAPAGNDGKTVYRLEVKDVPVDSFWSISVYNAQGFFEKNQADAYTLNNITAKRDANGAVRVQFGGCDGKVVNCLPVTPGWNYTVRLYRPHAEVLAGAWKFPAPQPVN